MLLAVVVAMQSPHDPVATSSSVSSLQAKLQRAEKDKVRFCFSLQQSVCTAYSLLSRVRLTPNPCAVHLCVPDRVACQNQCPACSDDR